MVTENNEVIEESHETVSDQILLLIFLLLLSNWISSLLQKKFFKKNEENNLMVINDQAISLILGILTGLIMVNPPFMKDRAKILEKQIIYQDGPAEDLLLLFQVLIVPPLVYESSVTMLKKVKMFTRIGTLLISVTIGTFLSFAILTFCNLLFKFGTSSIILALIVQVNDYSGTLDPHVSFAINDDESLSFLGFQALLKNSILLFLIFNLTPYTKTTSDEPKSQILYGIYQLLMPSLIALGLAIPTTLVVKQQDKYQNLTQKFSHFDIAMFIITPTLAYLVAETFSCSGLNTLICLGIFQSIYTKQNLNNWQNRIVEQAIMFIAYFNRQMGAILIGIILPFYVELIEFSILKVVLFIILVPFIQILVTYSLQNILMDKLNWTLNNSLLSKNEKTAMLLQVFSSSGVLTFTCAYATRNQYVITFVLVQVSLSIIFNLTLSVFLIKYKNYLSAENDRQLKFEINESEIQYQNEENITVKNNSILAFFGRLKSWIIDLHLDKIEPNLVRQKIEDDEPVVKPEKDESAFFQRDTRQDYYSKTSGAKFVAETTQSLMGSDGQQYGPKRESSFELSEISSSRQLKDESHSQDDN